MAATVNTVAVRAAALAKLQAIAQGLTYNVAAFNELALFISQNALTYSDASTDLWSFIDNGYTGSGANTNNDFATIAPQMTVAELSALMANVTTWIAALTNATAGQLATMAGRPMV